MHFPTQLEDDPTNSNPSSPIIKSTFSLSHPLIVTTSINTNICDYTSIEPEFHASQPFANCIFPNLQMGGADAAALVGHANAVVAHDNSSSGCAATCADSGAPFT